MYLIIVDGENWYNEDKYYVTDSLEKAYSFAKDHIKNMDIYWVEESDEEKEAARKEALDELDESYAEFGERFYVVDILECKPLKEIE